MSKQIFKTFSWVYNKLTSFRNKYWPSKVMRVFVFVSSDLSFDHKNGRPSTPCIVINKAGEVKKLAWNYVFFN